MLPFIKKIFSFTTPDVRHRAENATVNFTLSTFNVPSGLAQLSYPNTTAITSMKIYQSYMARNLLFNGNKRATGIDVTVGERSRLLSAPGSVGPRETLDRYNITVSPDIPEVGQNLHDTPNIGSIVHFTNIPGSGVHGGRGRPLPRLPQLHGVHGVAGVIQR
ncbi:hypothetical protein EJ02DRAFT_514489 [Clathrospora elynae]|uniref:Glucose-methanol-choline oxidoreductase N-terminal domain-containing protein n=1 Tax=Clathrospora elynae TaxID=706981 RepID=A0A6A5SF63_9PLEO|nr:hypothetical protein EJ02DRAFT_514489 [Clathrospora elynae]